MDQLDLSKKKPKAEELGVFNNPKGEVITKITYEAAKLSNIGCIEVFVSKRSLKKYGGSFVTQLMGKFLLKYRAAYSDNEQSFKVIDTAREMFVGTFLEQLAKIELHEFGGESGPLLDDKKMLAAKKVLLRQQ